MNVYAHAWCEWPLAPLFIAGASSKERPLKGKYIDLTSLSAVESQPLVPASLGCDGSDSTDGNAHCAISRVTPQISLAALKNCQYMYIVHHGKQDFSVLPFWDTGHMNELWRRSSGYSMSSG